MAKNLRLKDKSLQGEFLFPKIEEYKRMDKNKTEEYKLMNKSQIQKYKALFTNINYVEIELDAVRNCLIQCEKPNFYNNVTPEEQKMVIAKFTQMFKILLELKHEFENMNN